MSSRLKDLVPLRQERLLVRRETAIAKVKRQIYEDRRRLPNWYKPKPKRRIRRRNRPEQAITLFGEASSPADNGSQAGPGALAITPPASMTAGDLPIIISQYRGTEQLVISETGGQCWHSFDPLPATGFPTNQSYAVHYATFNGTWSANPSILAWNGGTLALSAWMIVFRPTNTTDYWVPDVGPVPGTFTAGTTPFTKTITAITTVAANTVVLALWFTADDNTWDSLSGTNWSKSSISAQIRNLQGTDISMTAAYQIKTSAGTTNNVSQNQATNGGDAGGTLIFSLSPVALPEASISAGTPARIQSTEIQPGIDATWTRTFSAVTSGSAIIGSVQFESTGGIYISSIADNQSNTYYQVIRIGDHPLQVTTVIFFCPNITNAPTEVTVTFTSATNGTMFISEVSNISKFDKGQTKHHPLAGGANPTYTCIPSITPTRDKAYLFGVIGLTGVVEADGWFTAQNSFTNRQDMGGAEFTAMFADRVLDPAASVAFAASVTGDEWAAIMACAAFIPAAAGATPLTQSASDNLGDPGQLEATNLILGHNLNLIGNG